MNDFDFEQEIYHCAQIKTDWEMIDNKTILITGASGMIGKYIIEVLLKRNQMLGLHTRIIALGRNKNHFLARIGEICKDNNLVFIEHDVCNKIQISERIDYIIHLASNTHPRLYAIDPIGTEMVNILGTYNVLVLAACNPGCRMIFASSGDIYGDNVSQKEFFEENDCGYLNCNTLRAGYIESKRAGEALCNAFKESKKVDFVIARLCRIYGPTVNLDDSKAITQFIKNAINGQNIILKSSGQQVFSYLYIYDVVSALLTVMTKGIGGEAYNIASNEQALSLRDLAAIISKISKREVIFNKPDEIEAKGASSFQNVKLDSSKLCKLGWSSEVGIEDGLRWTIKHLSEET